jgi:hypothetical protein
MQHQFKIGLAMCISKNVKWMNEDHKSEIRVWLNQQIENYGGDGTLMAYSESDINVKDLCMFAYSQISL